MLRALRTLLGLGDRHPPAAEPDRAPSAEEPAPPPPPSARAPAAGAAADLDDPFAPFAETLGVPVPAPPPPLSAEDAAADEALTARVLERVRASRPEQASFPAAALEVLNLVANPDAQLAELTRVVSRDPALSAGVLSYANSPVFRGVTEVETVREAVARLGVNEVGRAAAAVAARTLFSPRVRAESAVAGPRSDALFRRGLAVATAAAGLALRQGGARADRVYLGGLLHDVGKSLALFAVARLVLDRVVPQPAPDRLERVLDGVNVPLGVDAHRAWALPAYLLDICARQHELEVPPGAETVDLHLVRLTAAVGELREPFLAARAAAEVVQSAAALHLDPFAVRTLAAELRQAEAKSTLWPPKS